MAIFPVGITYNLQNAIFTYRRGFPLRMAALAWRKEKLVNVQNLDSLISSRFVADTEQTPEDD